MVTTLTISKDFPFLEKKNVVIIVTGKQTAKLFVVKSGTLKEEKTIDIPNPSFDNKKGTFMRSGHGKIYGSGSVHKTKADQVRIEFKNELEKYLKTLLSKKRDAIFLLCPSYMKDDVLEVIPTQKQKLITELIEGNFYKLHPFTILKKIAEKRSNAKSKKEIIDPEARKILKKGKNT